MSETGAIGAALAIVILVGLLLVVDSLQGNHESRGLGAGLILAAVLMLLADTIWWTAQHLRWLR